MANLPGFLPFLFVPFYLPPDAKDLAETFGRAEDHEVTTGFFFAKKREGSPNGVADKNGLVEIFVPMFCFSKLFFL